MSQEEAPLHGGLLRRAHALLENAGEPVAEEELIQQLFSTENGVARVWASVLQQTLSESTLFERLDDTDEGVRWCLTAWRKESLPLEEVEFVVVDTETTGLRPASDRIIELAAVRMRAGQMLESFHSLVHPRRSIPPFIVKFTGITPDMLADAPGAETVMPEFMRFAEGAVLVGHNLSFDLNFLSQEAMRLGQTFEPDGFDTIPLARRLVPDLKRFKLDMVVQHLQIPAIPAGQRHRAMGDARATAEVFRLLLERARQQGIMTLGQLRLRLQLPVAWDGDITSAKPKKGKGWRADSSVVALTRPNGSLFLNPAWKRNFPARPGVYLMKDEHQQVIYVGKAKSLKDRLASYYSQPLGYVRKLDGLLQRVRDIEIRVLGSELEALLLESRLIKELQPMYNVQLRNYELYPFIKIDVQHTFPRVYATREIAADGARYFGPFRSRRMVDATIELIQKIFPIRTCTRSLPPQGKATEPCLRLHLGRCPGPCRGGVDPTEYRKIIEQVCAFLGGEREDLIERLRRQMFEAAQQLNFERAAWLRDAIRSADEVLIGQRLITGAVEANNLFIVYPSAEEQCNEIFLIRHGRLVEQRRVEHDEQRMKEALRELLRRAEALGEPPAQVGQAEVDQINIISRWIHRHSEDRAFFPFHHALAHEQEAQALLDHIWREVELARAAPAAEWEELQG
ncbi:DNA polymerase-3 subunit epsilon [Thermosporothrix hazakensis]|uniref:DNA polymerase-3 subunit epsilon n=1 Tax=Thermosporothrix hazakensis TaxID=644383 RepID=A0A326UBG1_THEHA|nr:exonuclease domain-containing protein [Thermosporothrix hazakensis]PZW35932.1 DNA polymerase-3 subunit epsilon [Thermosporothrix hazakensis]GCE46587.1 hypothetical protein KTH_14560 [Thermosporothrix hazakensis]